MPTAIERIGSSDIEVELLPELGARLHRLRVLGHDVLRTPSEMAAYHREPFFWGSFVMAPWCNRLPAGPMPVGHATVDLPANFADGTAIHGQVQSLAWDVTAPGEYRVAGGGAGGWPWPYEVALAVRVLGSTLSLAHTLTNRSSEPMPAGIGIHPWLLQPLEIQVPAHRVFASNTGSSPQPEPVGGAFDLRRLQPMPPDLDATWTDLRAPVELRWPAWRLGARLRSSSAARYLCAASPSALGAVAVEPQTHAPDGLRRLVRGEVGGLETIAPGGSLALEVEIEFTWTHP